jgi:hypothetical protein
MKRNRLSAARVAILNLAATAALLACSRVPKGAFETPEAAFDAVGEIAGTGNTEKLVEIFGPEGPEIFSSGDPDQDREDGLRAKAWLAEKLAFEDVADGTKIALLGNDAWPFPIPLVKHEDGFWRFDTAAGQEELLNRRIGRNELLVLASLRAYVDAQREYFSKPREGDVQAYARRFLSSEGKRDGLYWPAAEGEEESPLGPLLAEAAAEHAGEPGPIPFNGYYFRILEAQGDSAPGGGRSYLDEQGRLTQGFGAVAWPAKHGNSGIMTFQVNRQGLIFQKDLGEDTENAVKAVHTYDPDEGWHPTPD